MQLTWASSQHGTLRVIRLLIRQLASFRTRNRTEPQKSYGIAVTVSYESKFSPRASPDSRGRENTRAWILASLVYWWRGRLWKLATIDPFLPANFSFICHWAELCHRSISKPTTGKDNGVRISHHTKGCTTIRGQHHCIMRSHQGGLTRGFPILLWIHWVWFVRWSLPSKSKHILTSPQDRVENQELKT